MSLADDLDALVVPTDPPPHVVKPDWTSKVLARADVDAEGATVESGATDKPILAADDWDGVLRHFGLNPDEFEIVDDTVRMSSWQQSKGHEDGTRDVITLYSYRARFKRVRARLAEKDLAETRKLVHRWKPLTRRTLGTGLGAPSTFYVGWADWQIGKDGTREFTVQRALDSFEDAVLRLKQLRKLGRNVERIAIANMGDPTEGCYGNYESQLHTIEMNQRDQLNTALDLWLTGVRTFAPLADDVQFISVLCNHGEWTRKDTGTKPVTSDSDNVGGFLADTLRTVLADRPDFEHVRYVIPRSEMTVMADLSGVPVAFNHGHKTPGQKAELEWLQAQSIRMLREQGREPRLWMLAHRHHYDIKDMGPWWRVQHPSLDIGSKYFADAAGKWSSPGTLTMLVGEHAQAGGPLSGVGRGFSDEYLIVPRA